MHTELQPVAKASTEDEPKLIRAINDRYRFPAGFLDFRLSGELARDSGFFQFGPATCYGRSIRNGKQAQSDSPLCDLLSSASSDGTHLVLPFDPTEVIDNLLLERYPSGQFGAYERILKSVYYWFRPFTNRALRKYIQKLRASDWQNKRFPKWPVDTTVENLCESLLLLWLQANPSERIPFIWFWPAGSRACVSMTHDVETAAGRDFCGQLLDFDDLFGVKASFQIVPEQRYQVTQEFLSKLRDRGFEVCVQDLNHDGRLFDQRDEFLRRAALINRYGEEYGAKGFRSAVLYRKPEWYGDLDFSYDMSIPNVAHLDPQRGGCCTVMPYFIGDVLELPLTTVQDYTLFHVLNEQSISLWRTQLEMILSKNGMASFIVHPDYITEPKTQAVYKDLLTALSELRKQENLWFALPRDIDCWWRARNQMSIVRDGESWRIIGEGADRAVLAFAKVVDGNLVYELPDAPAN